MPQFRRHSMDTTEIRPLSTSDIGDAVRLLALMNPETPEDIVRERLETMLRDHAHYELLGAFVGGRLAGVAGAWVATKIWCGRYLEIDNIVVDPGVRGGGVGSALISRMVESARERGCRVAVLDTYVSNHASHRLYHRLGFEVWGFHFIKPLGDWKGNGGAE